MKRQYVLLIGVSFLFLTGGTGCGHRLTAATRIQPLPAQEPLMLGPVEAEGPAAPEDSASLPEAQSSDRYTVGADDVLQFQVIQPEQISITAAVSPDGFISFPYIGNIYVKEKTLTQVQKEIEQRLSDGYMKYPTVSVALQESKSRKFFVYGEVNKPGAYPLEDNTTLLRAISLAGGFTKYGSSSRVKILKSATEGAGYEMRNVNIAKVMKGTTEEDVVLGNGDIVVVSEGIF